LQEQLLQWQQLSTGGILPTDSNLNTMIAKFPEDYRVLELGKPTKMWAKTILAKVQNALLLSETCRGVQVPLGLVFDGVLATGQDGTIIYRVLDAESGVTKAVKVCWLLLVWCGVSAAAGGCMCVWVFSHYFPCAADVLCQ
jgi:hypothetical protein